MVVSIPDKGRVFHENLAQSRADETVIGRDKARDIMSALEDFLTKLRELYTGENRDNLLDLPKLKVS